MSMTFEKLVRLSQEKLGLTSQEATKDFIYWFFDTIEHAVVQEKARVRIPNFGTFVKRHRKERTNKSITNGSIITIPAVTALGFKPSASRLVKHV